MIEPVPPHCTRKWVRCKTCQSLYYYDTPTRNPWPYNPVVKMHCGHGLGVISLKDATDEVTEEEAMNECSV